MESEELMSSLPKEKGWMYSYLYKFQGFWYGAKHLQGAIKCQKQFQAQNSDVLLITSPKSGTTWLKAIIFTLVNRTRYPVEKNHPLLNKNPHDLVPFLEANLYDNQIQDQSSFRLFAAHVPYHSLPKTVHDSACKIIYLCRNPKDTFVSLWHFSNNLKPDKTGTNSLEDAFDLFCRGVSPCGPFWDHVLDYWKEFKENSERILFLRYEDMKEEPGVHLRRLAQFLGCPFLAVEEETGMVEEILKLCGFDNLSKLEINRTGKLANGVENKAFFRRGEVGDWKNLLPISMVKTIDQITEQKFSGVGLVL
ncbi:cytosolic sulfotransferase 12-like [Olea europaea subsp. europaea]|uniref:Sulfotransferase n=2 Tax=Olea europaea subsp. europaea TaxID=158383 RepID=A0A8S0RPF6_OLEEU|nr:cytosolic sulfotransferase 12-like [Olea europaea subsp. europaea]